MNVTYFNARNLNLVRDRVNEALATVAKELGLDIQVAGCKYSNNIATYELEARTLDEDGNAFDQDAANFEVFCEDYDLCRSDLGKTFTNNGKRYTISGLKPRNRKYPILATRADGKRFKFPIWIVKQGLEKSV